MPVLFYTPKPGKPLSIFMIWMVDRIFRRRLAEHPGIWRIRGKYGRIVYIHEIKVDCFFFCYAVK